MNDEMLGVQDMRNSDNAINYSCDTNRPFLKHRPTPLQINV